MLLLEGRPRARRGPSLRPNAPYARAQEIPSDGNRREQADITLPKPKHFQVTSLVDPGPEELEALHLLHRLPSFLLNLIEMIALGAPAPGSMIETSGLASQWGVDGAGGPHLACSVELRLPGPHPHERVTASSR
mgnify:CR=1 FL=1